MRSLLLAIVSLAIGCRRGPSSAPAHEPRARLVFEVRDTSGHLIPARLTLVGVGDTPEPKLGSPAEGSREGRVVLAGNKVMTLDGSGEVGVPYGTYDIYASRGIEWTIAIAPRVVLDERGYTFRAKLDRVIDTTGWLSADFHVHASPSWDSDVPQATRVIEFTTEGMDMIVSTDHNVVADYGPIIAELGLRSTLASMIGDELTTYAWGHFGLFPLPAALVGHRYGGQWRHDTHGRAVIEGARHDHPGALIQVNHPRSNGEMGYFNDERFDRATARSTHDGFSLDFDVLEVLNGYESQSKFDDVLRDWFSLLDHGRVVTATGNSDTHHLDSAIGGYPRNYLRVADDRPAKATDADVVAALRGHHALFTTGPFVTMTSGSAGIGDLVAAPDGKVVVSIEVTAAPWIDVDEVTLYVDGEARKTWSVPATELPQRLEVTQAIEITRDAYIVASARGDAPMWPVVGNAEHHQALPLALTNPIFVDRDGDGRFTSRK